MTFEDYARDLLDTGETFTIDHAKILTLALIDSNEHEILTQCVFARLRIFQRNDTRQAEQTSELTEANQATPTGQPADPIADRRAYLTKYIRIPGQVDVLWSEATVEQLQVRITYFERRIAGHQRSIDIMKEAIRRIEEAGVSCLGEIPEDTFIAEIPDDLLWE